MGRASAKVPIRKLLATDDVYHRGFHKGNPGGLDAVDAQLAAANIKEGITIFGFLGTFAGGALAEDTVGSDTENNTCATAGAFHGNCGTPGADGEADIASVTKTFNDPSFAVGSAFCEVASDPTQLDFCKLRCYIDGVQVGESVFFDSTIGENYIAVGTKDVSGDIDIIIKATLHNYGGAQYFRRAASFGTGGEAGGGVAVGAIKA